jgi:hypothetical protein
LQASAGVLVATGASDAAAVFRIFALAVAIGERALAALNAILGAQAAAQAVGQHAAEVLQRGARQFIFRAAMDLEAAGALFELHFAARHNTPIAGGRRCGGEARGLPGWRAACVMRCGRETFRQNYARHARLLSVRQACAAKLIFNDAEHKHSFALSFAWTKFEPPPLVDPVGNDSRMRENLPRNGSDEPAQYKTRKTKAPREISAQAKRADRALRSRCGECIAPRMEDRSARVAQTILKKAVARAPARC